MPVETQRPAYARSTPVARSRYVPPMRLSGYPYVTVRVACSRCPRRGAYRLARLADRYGAEAAMHSVLTMLAADCKLAERERPGIDRCGAFFPDLGGGKPPDEPVEARAKLRVIR